MHASAFACAFLLMRILAHVAMPFIVTMRYGIAATGGPGEVLALQAFSQMVLSRTQSRRHV